ncbi:PE family protein [Nocardia transvalensis]|uniref:PE family protein n=1 Tax=Nocardia transvalensis TaxID=37333 RepID=UPI0018947284|nr:PE family protein [Nocardia transvalensis]MBF6327523.1 PE family protein [Nocardia transvalensis]
MKFDPVRAQESAAGLDALADRLEADLRTHAPALAVAPAGLDEVSRHAADTMRTVASSYDEAATAGVLELRKLAAALRSQSQQLTGMDADNALGLAAI